jgi:hypothetical protein
MKQLATSQQKAGDQQSPINYGSVEAWRHKVKRNINESKRKLSFALLCVSRGRNKQMKYVWAG